MADLRFDTDLLSLLPPWYREILDYQEICLTEQAQFEALAKEITAVADNFFFQTMDMGSVAMWEKIFEIMADLSGETLDFRRSRILNRVSTRPPFTLNFLRQKLDELIGAGQWTVEMDYPNYTLYIESAAYNQNYATEISYTIGRIKPAHIVFVNRPYTVSGIALSETITLDRRVYSYRLGSWGLGVGPFAASETLGVIKTADVPSIQPALLSDTAKFVADDIVYAQLNGSIQIDNLTKTVDGAALSVTYTVGPAQVSAVTEAALLSKDGIVLTRSTVYVPVNDLTMIKHLIPIKEGGQANGE